MSFAGLALDRQVVGKHGIFCVERLTIKMDEALFWRIESLLDNKNTQRRRVTADGSPIIQGGQN